ncbi:MAG: sugar ABC transporter permease [Trueperaceae bacterium]
MDTSVTGIPEDVAAVRSRLWRRRLKLLVPYLLILPAYTLLAFLLLYPMVSNFYLSVWEWRLTNPSARTFAGLQNYLDLFQTQGFTRSLFFTLLFTGATVALSFVLGFLSALLLFSFASVQRVVTPLLILPYMVAPIAVGLIWRLMWNMEYGPVNYFGSLLGLSAVNWLGSVNTAVVAVIVSEVWRTTPFVMLILLAGLSAIPTEVYEAAKVDGARGLQVLRHVTLPLLAPSITVALIFETIFKLRVFDLIYTLTGGGPASSTTPLGLLIYNTYFRYLNGGQSAALSVVLFGLGLVICIVYIKTLYRTWEA